MWRDGDFSDEWTSLDGLFSRIEEWCGNAESGWESDLLDQDAYMNFQPKDAALATFDLTRLDVTEGGWGEFHGVLGSDRPLVDIAPGRKRATTDHLRGLWFHVGQLSAPPPRQLSEIFSLLPRSQRRELQRALDDRRKPDPFTVSGGLDLILFCWERLGRTDLLILACRGPAGAAEAVALRLAPYDEASLILRAGPDAPLLRTRRAVMFGAGALGGHTAVILAESGLGFLEVVDSDVLLPGNVVRHVAGHTFAGVPKVRAVQAAVLDHAPWTKVTCYPTAARTPDIIRERISDADIVVDTTGSESLAFSLALTAQEMGKPLVSGALYKGGFIGRVQRQALGGDTPIHQREDSSRYPVIPAGDESEDFASPQLGCSATVNNAPLSAAVACASLIVQVATDVLTQRYEFSDEEIDVYRAISAPPFNRTGRVDQIRVARPMK